VQSQVVESHFLSPLTIKTTVKVHQIN
jgi:hypothetical protein